MTAAVKLAPRIASRRALVFLDGEAARFAHALRVSGFEVTIDPGEDPRPVLDRFLAAAEPGELLLIRWPSGAGWGPTAFTKLIMDFGREVAASGATALLLVVDFGWIVRSDPADPGGAARLNVPGDPPVAAAALTASLSAAPGGPQPPGAAPSLTGVLADGLLAAGGPLTVQELYGLARRHFERLGSDLSPMLFSHGDIEEVEVRDGRSDPGRAGASLDTAARKLAEAGEEVPGTAGEIVARLYDLHLGSEAQCLLRRAGLLPGELTREAAALLGCPGGYAELEAWGLTGPAHPAVREAGLALLDAAEAALVSGLLRRQKAHARPAPPRTRLTPDRWTLDDRLGHRVYAEAIAAFIRHPDTAPPLTIGIKGPWGAGKTSLMRMVRELLDPGSAATLKLAAAATEVTNAEVLGRLREGGVPYERAEAVAGSGWRPTVWFNPWMYQNGEQVWAGLAHELISQITGRMSRTDRERFWLELNLSRIDREAVRRRLYRLAFTRLLPVALGLVFTLVLAGAAWAASSMLPWLSDAAAAIASAGCLASLAAGTVRLGRFFAEGAGGAFGTLVNQPDPFLQSGVLPEHAYGDKAGFLHLVQTDMRRVLGLVATEERPLVVFVDDLDRCSSSTVAQVIEAINLFLAGEFPNCVFVLAMEPEMVAAHVQVAYRQLLTESIGWRFLEKIVQLPLSVPLLDDEERLPAYVRALLGVPEEPLDAPALAPPPRAAVPAQVARGKLAAGRTVADPGIVEELERLIREQRPSVDGLDEAAERAQASLGFAGRNGRLTEPARVAADRVFADLYRDENACRAIEAALPALGLRNPREVKRYLNVFRFYSFVTYRRAQSGRPRASDAEVAKLAALTIRWPHLLSTLTRESHPGATLLDRLEAAAQRGDGDTWVRALLEAGLQGEEELRQFLATRPLIARLAAELL
ncbi:P-loop NTPase fold protein [Nonomuraea sp. NPDC050310]|uniref:KAP family P-loop NTPase fold protein n=1 Tax=Nonomuraea sp. NPDC050310 TaxID=3154935 RepID=UPI0033DFE62E